MNAPVHTSLLKEPPLVPLKDQRQQVAEFLGTRLPDDFELNGEVTLLRYETQITKLIRERRPWFIIDRCAAIKGVNEFGRPNYTVWAVTEFTEAMVAGHFPGAARLPFVDLAKMIAQASSIACALQVNNPTLAPIGIGSSGSSADAADLIHVPVTVLAQVQVHAQKMGVFHFKDACVYVDGERIGTVNGIRYLARPSPDLPFSV